MRVIPVTINVNISDLLSLSVCICTFSLASVSRVNINCAVTCDELLLISKTQNPFQAGWRHVHFKGRTPKDFDWLSQVRATIVTKAYLHYSRKYTMCHGFYSPYNCMHNCLGQPITSKALDLWWYLQTSGLCQLNPLDRVLFLKVKAQKYIDSAAKVMGILT